MLGARESIAPLPGAAQRARACATAAARLEQICAPPPPVNDPAIPSPLPGHGSLGVEHAILSYESGGPRVLDGLDLELGAGEHVALIGPSGAGKTTLAELLVRFRDPDEGRVTLDGIDVRHISQDTLRAAVLLCGQDAHLFNTSLRENLLIADPGASDGDLWQALTVVELDDWAAVLPQGLDTPVGQCGELVSGGQRQRLALARALLSPAHFLILDEPTAHLDGPLAARVLERVLAHTPAQGVLVITHTTAALEHFDRVLELADGRLTQIDRATMTHEPQSSVKTTFPA